MSLLKVMLSEFAWDERYRVLAEQEVLTPALLVYPQKVALNVSRTLHLLGGDPNRWRVHIKTAKLGYTLRMLVENGVRNFKCATTLELWIGCQNGAEDILLAYPVMGANARRASEIARQFPRVRISTLAENEGQVNQWRNSSVGIFIDINPGMNRTGVPQGDTSAVIALARKILDSGIDFRGLHYYDGQFGGIGEPERTRAAQAGYASLLALISKLERNHIKVPEVVTAGTPTFPSSLDYKPFNNQEFLHRVSPGTIVYCDATSLAQLPPSYGYAPSVLVLSRIVSQPRKGIVTCDAGHKAVSADAGIPTCLVVGHSDLTPLSPSEEHLPMECKQTEPRVGDPLYLLPRHVCPTVNNFDTALLVRDGIIQSEEPVSARGHEKSFAGSSESAIGQRT